VVARVFDFPYIDLMTGQPKLRWRTVLAVAWRAAVLILFLLSLAFVFINNRFTPTRAAARQCVLDSDDASLVVVDGFCLWFRDRGQRGTDRTIILLHGGPDFPTLSYDDAFRYLEADYRVIAYDQRGSGRSQVREPLSYYTMSQLVQELELLRRDVIRSDSVILIGHLLGGTLALQYTLAYPAYVDRVVLISPLPPEGARMTSMLDPFVSTLSELVAFGLPPADPAEADRWHRHAVHLSVGRAFLRRDLAARVRETGGSFGASRALMESLAAGRRQAMAGLRGCAVPVLVLGGAFHEPSWMPSYRQQLADTLPRAHGITFSESGEWPFFEEPARFQTVITAFLRGESPS
jgi:proline iminopeptidase